MGSLYGFEVESELPLRRLNRAPGERGTLRVELAREPLAAPAGEPVSVLEDEAGTRRWYSSYETGDGCMLVLPPSGSFLLEPGEGRVVVDVGDGDPELLEHRVASSAICTLLSLRGDLVLHASGVEAGGRTILFCGPTGRGKSTLARGLGEEGCRVLGEDGIAVALEGTGAIAFPGARGVRVRRQEGDGTRTHLLPDPGPGEPSPSPLAAIVLLRERGGALDVEPLKPVRALPLLTPNLIHSGSRREIGAAFSRLAGALHTVPAFAASLPDDLGALRRAARELLDSAAGRG